MKLIHRMTFRCCLLIFCSLGLIANIGFAQSAALQAPVSRTTETANFAEIFTRVKELVEIQGAEHVLFVVDIDNTLLAMDQDLGSDQWFNWQSQLLNKSTDSSDLVASNIDGLLQVQGTLFALSEMHPPEPIIPAVVNGVQIMKCKSIVLTSRGPEYRDAAERELVRNKYQFSESALPITEPRRGRFKPFDKSKPDVHGLSADELKRLRDPRDVTYSNGIFMVAGQHKGYMLRTLLARADQNFKTIVFVDDHEKHTERMHEAFKETGIDIVCFRYSREDGNVASFETSNKRHVVTQWDRLKEAIELNLIH